MVGFSDLSTKATLVAIQRALGTGGTTWDDTLLLLLFVAAA